MSRVQYIAVLFLLFFGAACSEFDEFNDNPNEPTQVSADVLLPNAIRESVNTAVDASFLVGNNAAQLTAKTLRLEVDAYDWNAFPKYWEGWYESLTDILLTEQIAITNNNEQLQGAAIVLRAWVFQNLTNAYGNIPYAEATRGATDNFTPAYSDQEFIYNDLLDELVRAEDLLAGSGSIDGDILLNGDADQWRKFANSLRLRLLMYAGDQIPDAGARFRRIVDEGNILSSNADNVTLTYAGSFPNEFPLIPLKIGDFDAVAIAAASVDVMEQYNDPRLTRYARPNNDDYDDPAGFIGAVNGQGADCPKEGASRLGVSYYNYPSLVQASNLGLSNAEGIIMTYPEVAFLLAEAAHKGWIDAEIEPLYRAGIEASMAYNQVNLGAFGWESFDDFYTNSEVAYNAPTDIWEQKWLALFFHGLEPYFEVRRWYHESGNSFAGIPFLDPACGNVNGDRLPLRFLYPGEEQSLNAANYQLAIEALGGENSQNATMWIVE